MRVLDRFAVEDTSLYTVDDHAEEAHLADDLVNRRGADEVLLTGVGEAVESGSEQGEKVALDLVASRNISTIRALDVIRRNQHAHAANTDQDTDDLGNVIADAEEYERRQDNNDDGPEIDQLGTHHGGVLVREDHEVVALDIAERENDIYTS